MPLVERWRERSVKGGIAVFSLLCVCGVAATDFVTRYETAVSLLYLVPIWLAVWFSWGAVAVSIALLSGLSDSILTFLSRRPYAEITLLNSALQSVFFIVFVYVLLALKKAHRALSVLARTDPLTALANSRHFAEAGQAEIERQARYKHPFSLAYMDMDDFKSVNDTLGHGTGDSFLRDIADRARKVMRKTDMIARLGGDEFAILMPETDAAAAAAAVSRIQKSLAGVMMPKGGRATFSVGVITNLGRRCSFDEMIRAADALMYEAKHSGKDAIKAGTLA